MKPVLILSGPIGAGKTTVASELVRRTPAPAAYIEGDVFWSFIAKGVGRTDRSRDFRMVMRAMMSAAMHYALSDYSVVLDFSIPPWFLDTARKIAQFREVPLDYVVIKPSEAICAARAATRLEGVIADYTKYHDLYIDFDEAAQYTISDDSADAAAIAERIKAGIDARLFRL